MIGNRFWLHASLVMAFALLLPACSKKDDEYVERPVEELYNEAMDNLDKDEYVRAAKSFEEVERQHPYSVWATKAQLMGAYAMYERNKYDDAIVNLDRFIQLHPGNKDAPYAYYLKGLCYYEQIADVARDQKMTELALKSLQEVVDRFPSSFYALDAKMKVDLARDHLAGKEMTIGRYYLRNQQPLAALNRFRVVVETFQTTSHVPEALHRMVEIYLMLGLRDDANRTAAVLGHNYPGTDWYEESFALLKTGKSATAKGNGMLDWIPGFGGPKAPTEPTTVPKSAAKPGGKPKSKSEPGLFDWMKW
ncbi:MAG: outer membrane protein assembly factor BamD [Magnetospirillum sp.]|nr:outer membrane protein assembly factor BamD [Magnetospirillum sp.]